MGIRTTCPNGHPLHLKAFLAGRTGICPHCQARFTIPGEPPPRETTSQGYTDIDAQREAETNHVTQLEQESPPVIPFSPAPTTLARTQRTGRPARKPGRHTLANRLTVATILTILSVLLFVLLLWRLRYS